MKESVDFIKELIARDLDRLRTEIESYKDESNMWRLSGDISNTSGNLCLHICGNLKHFIGAEMGKTGYIRKRDEEFSLKDVSKSELIEDILNTKQIVTSCLEVIDEDVLSQKCSFERLGQSMSNHSFLIYIAAHLNYHLGQINYQRRLMD